MQVKQFPTAGVSRHNARAPLSAGAAALATGTVKAFLTDREAVVETGQGRSVHARQATSCLLAPVIGDVVLVLDGEGGAYVLAVLERPGQHIAELAVPGIPHVRLSAADIELESTNLTICAEQAQIRGRTLSLFGDALFSSFRRIVENVVDKTVGARSITTTAQLRTAAIADVDTLRAGALVQSIETVATQQSEIALVSATEDVRLDAKRVSVG